MNETRKFAAILVADVGYSRLAGADEDSTFARLWGVRSDLIDPAIAAHHGRIINRTGDGIIIEFRSVIDAVRCALAVESGMVERNAGVPEDRRIQFRVGIHLGDVVEESDGDLMGSLVNQSLPIVWSSSDGSGSEAFAVNAGGGAVGVAGANAVHRSPTGTETVLTNPTSGDAEALTWSLVNQSLPTGYSQSNPNAINNSGTIAGDAYKSSTAVTDAFTWSDTGSYIQLTSGGNADSVSEALGINASGGSVGFQQGSTAIDAMYWNSSGTGTLLTDAGGYGDSQAESINASGQIAGWSLTSDDTSDAVLWTDTGSYTVLTALDGSNYSFAKDINPGGYSVGVSDNEAVEWNSSGSIVWSSSDSSGSEAFAVNAGGGAVGVAGANAVHWSPTGTETVLTNPTSGDAEALDIDMNGYSCGYAGNDAMLWTSTGTDTILHTGSSGNPAEALAINYEENSVGFFTNSSGVSIAAWWNSSGTETNLQSVLNSFGSGWSGTVANAINNESNFDIAGYGTFDGAYTSFELLYNASAASADRHSTSWEVQEHDGFALVHASQRQSIGLR